MNYKLEIQKILLKTKDLNDLSLKIKVLKEAMQIADRHNDIDWGFDLRLQLIDVECRTSRCEESFPAFAWILNATDSNKDYFDESDFLWEYKWMFASAYRNASIPEKQILSIGEDLRKRMKRNGYSDRAYYTVMVDWYEHRGEIGKMTEYVELFTAELEDDMSHCTACEEATKVENLLLRGEMDQAVLAAQDLISGKLSCYSQPFSTFSRLAYAFLRAGDPRAEEYFKRAQAECAAKDYGSTVLYVVMLMMYYMYKTKNDEFWDFFEKASEWEVGAEDSVRFSFAQHMLPIFKNGGKKPLNLSSKLPYYNSEGLYDLNEVYEYYKKTAYDLADKFDARNGNTHFDESLEKLLSEN